MKNKIVGGLADGKSATDIAQKHGVSQQQIDKELSIGLKEELKEHTGDKDKAREICLDHLFESPSYYSDMEKQERIEITADGKRELDFGKEPLDKDKKKKKKNTYLPGDENDGQSLEAKKTGMRPNSETLSKRAEQIKELLHKALNHEEAIMSIASDDDAEQPEPPPADSQPEEQETQEGGEEQAEEQPPEENEEPPAQEEEEIEQPPEENEEQVEGEEAPDEELSDADKSTLLENALKEEGHSDAEIAFILHDHGVPATDPVDQSKIDMNNAKSQSDSGHSDQKLQDVAASAELDRQHKQDMHDDELGHKQKMHEIEQQRESSVDNEDHEKNHKKRMNDLEYEQALSADTIDHEKEHDKRMKDLEYEFARKAKELEHEHKKAEHDLKLKQSHEKHGEQKQDRSAKRKEKETIKPKSKGGDK